MNAYYNEFDPEKAHMLRQLIADGHIAPGVVDERSIRDVRPEDLDGFTQCHFFAGIGGWSVALRLAGWSDDRPVWTGSCPCQDYSLAGERKRQQGERHEWPYWYRLIAERKPAKIFGEQVDAAITAGWWDEVATDLEAAENAVAAAVLPACATGRRHHRRYRLFFVADRYGQRQQQSGGHHGQSGRWIGDGGEESHVMANTASAGWDGARSASETLPASRPFKRPAGLCGDVGDTFGAGLEGFAEHEQARCQPGRFDSESNRPVAATDTIWLDCPDGKQRPVVDGIRLLVDGLHGRIPIIAAFGDAIVPEVAAAFIEASEGWQP